MDTLVVEKCQAFCQALTTGNHKFIFSLSIGKDNFNFETKELKTSSCEKKKKSPSQIRREEKRKEERRRESFLKTKAASPKDTPALAPEREQECKLCNKVFRTEKGLKSHKTRTHKKEILRTQHRENTPLQVSPAKEEPREEECICCGEVMSQNKCHGCGKEFSCETQLIEHIGDNHFCNMTFMEKDAVHKHWRKKHMVT